MRILKGKMTLQTSYQNDRQKVRICSISRKNDMRETWKKLWFLEEKRRELIFFVTKWGASRLHLNLYALKNPRSTTVGACTQKYKFYIGCAALRYKMCGCYTNWIFRDVTDRPSFLVSVPAVLVKEMSPLLLKSILNTSSLSP